MTSWSKFILITCIMLISMPGRTNAQQTFGEVLAIAEGPATDDSTRIAMYLKAGRMMRPTSQDTALSMMQRGLTLAENTRHFRMAWVIYDAMADYHRSLGHFGRCLELTTLALPRALDIGAYKEAGTLLQTRAAALAEQGKTTAAIKDYHRSIQYHEKAGYQKGVAMTTTNLGSIYYLIDQRDKALHYYKKGLQIQLQLGDSNSAALTYTALGQLYHDLRNIDSAQYYTEQGYAILALRPGLTNAKFKNVLSSFDYAMERNDIKRAEKWLSAAKDIATTEGSSFKQAQVYSGQATIAEKKGNTALAIRLLERALEGYLEHGHVQLLSQSYQSLSRYYERSGQYEQAYSMLRKHKQMQDSLYSTESAATIDEMNQKYETEKREKELAQKEHQLAEKDSQLKLLYVVVAAGILLVGAITGLFLQSRKALSLRTRIMAEQREREQLQALITGEEKERTRIARELHDGLGGILAASQMKLSSMATGNGQLPQLRETESLIATAAMEARRIAHNLLPATLTRLGLDEALREFCQSVQQTAPITVSYAAINMTSRLQPHVELAIYRIVQELLTNIVKHADATQATVQLQRHGNLLNITVEDNGKGLPEVQTSGGMGLENIRSRISYLKGTFNIRRDKQGGTSAFAELPLDQHNTI